jgi:hypothetical protein
MGMNTIDIIARVRAAVMGESEEVVRRAIVAENKNDPKTLAKLQEPIEDSKAEALLLELRVSMETMKAYAENDPDGFKKIIQEMSGKDVSEDEIQEAAWKHQAVYASHELMDRAKNLGQDGPTDVDREVLMQCGSLWWPHSWAHVESDDDFETAGKAMFALARETKNEQMLLALQTEIYQTHFLLTARWAHFGFPIVQLGSHKYAAALMATSFSPDTEVHPPWKTFLIEVPEGLLFTASGTGSGEKETVRYLLVSEHPVIRSADVKERAWSFTAFTAEGTMLHRMKMSLADHLQEPKEDSDYGHGEAFEVDLNTEDERTLLLLSRLMLSTCLAMSDPSNVKKVGKHSGEIKRGAKLPTCRVFRVGKPVEIDCRQALYDFVSGKRRDPLAVQFLVRGHWRNQACGPAMAERKWIWIEPYWKGPEDAPINMRPHKLGTK